MGTQKIQKARLWPRLNIYLIDIVWHKSREIGHDLNIYFLRQVNKLRGTMGSEGLDKICTAGGPGALARLRSLENPVPAPSCESG